MAEGPRSPEGRAARIMSERLSTLDFNERVFAYILNHGAGGKLKARLFNIFMHLCILWEKEIETGEYDSDSYETSINAARIIDTMENYGYEVKG